MGPRIGIGAASGHPKVEGPDLEPGAATRSPWDPRATQGSPARVFHVQIALRAKEKVQPSKRCPDTPYRARDLDRRIPARNQSDAFDSRREAQPGQGGQEAWPHRSGEQSANHPSTDPGLPGRFPMSEPGRRHQAPGHLPHARLVKHPLVQSGPR